MHPALKTFATISAASIGAWIRVAALGALVSAAGLAAAVWLFVTHGGHDLTDAVAPLVLTVTSLGAMAVYVPLANRHALQVAIRGLWEGTQEDAVMAHVHRAIEALRLRQPDWMTRAGSAANVKRALVQALMTDGAVNRLSRFVLVSGFRRLVLHDADLSRDDATFATVVTTGLRTRLAAFAQPSRTLFVIALTLHLATDVAAIAFGVRR